MNLDGRKKAIVVGAAALLVLVAVIASMGSHSGAGTGTQMQTTTTAASTTSTASGLQTPPPVTETTGSGLQTPPPVTETATTATIPAAALAPYPKRTRGSGCYKHGRNDPFDQLNKVARQRLTVAWQAAKAAGVNAQSGGFLPPRALEPLLHSHWVRFKLAYGPQDACAAGSDLALLDVHSTTTQVIFYIRSDSRTVWKLVGGTGSSAVVTRLDRRRSRRYVVNG